MKKILIIEDDQRLALALSVRLKRMAMRPGSLGIASPLSAPPLTFNRI